MEAICTSTKNVDFITKIGGLDIFQHIVTRYLSPWELIKLRSICKDFNTILFVQKHRIEDYYDFMSNYWQRIFQRSIIQLYCRPLIDETTNFFKYHTLLRISMDGLSNNPETMQAIKYLLLHQYQFATSSMKIERDSHFSKNISQLQGLYISNKEFNSTLKKFINDIISNYHYNNNSYFRLLFFNHCVLNNEGVFEICNAILKSPTVYNLEILFLSNDATLNDDIVPILFECIETKLIYLKMITLRNVGLTNVACNIIHDFYIKHSKNLCYCNSKKDIKNRQYPFKLNNINLTFNDGITGDGIQKLNELMFIDEGIPHNRDCYFNSMAIATSVSFANANGLALSNRFRILTQ